MSPLPIQFLPHLTFLLGDVAFEANKNVRLLIQPAALRCCSLYDSLLSLTRLRGSGSQASKTILVKKLLVAARGEEVRFLVRILAQNLRIGAVRLTLTTALARAFVLSRPKGASYTIDENFVTKEERQMMVEKEETAGKGKGKKGKGSVKEEEESVRADVGGKMDRAEALVRMVWARHPDEGSIVAALVSPPSSSVSAALTDTHSSSPVVSMISTYAFLSALELPSNPCSAPSLDPWGKSTNDSVLDPSSPRPSLTDSEGRYMSLSKRRREMRARVSGTRKGRRRSGFDCSAVTSRI